MRTTDCGAAGGMSALVVAGRAEPSTALLHEQLEAAGHRVRTACSADAAALARAKRAGRDRVAVAA